MPKEKKASRIELEKRIRTLQEYILQDYPSSYLIAHAVDQWQICERHAKRYIRLAWEGLKAGNEQDLARNKAYHIQRRHKLMRQLATDERSTAFGVKTQLEILKDLAKLQGAYPAEQHEINDNRPRPTILLPGGATLEL